MKTRKVIYADSGKVLTDGNAYGKVIFLADNVSESDFHEISEDEYEAILEKQNESNN